MSLFGRNARFGVSVETCTKLFIKALLTTSCISTFTFTAF